MLDKAKLGKRYTCYECGTKFYDLNRPAALCPECNADQAHAPARDIRSLLSGGGRKIVPVEEDEALDTDLKTGDDVDEDDVPGDDDDDLLAATDDDE